MSRPRPDRVAEHFVAIERALKRRGIPRHHRRRLLEELRDHACDLHAQFRKTGHTESEIAAQTIEALGGPTQLANAAARRLPWIARWPLIWFILFPILGFPVLGIVYLFLAGWLLDGWFTWHSDKSSMMSHALIYGLGGLGFYGVPIAIAAWLVRRSRLANLNMAWPTVSAIILFIIHCPITMHLTPPQTPTGQGSLGLSIWMGSEGYLPPWSTLLPSSLIFIPIALYAIAHLARRFRTTNPRAV